MIVFIEVMLFGLYTGYLNSIPEIHNPPKMHVHLGGIRRDELEVHAAARHWSSWLVLWDIGNQGIGGEDE